ncbi:MAG TPA: hypothetical protein VI385_15035 [Flavisolibacter sp.]|jgi:hypothetical protein
MNNSTIGHTSSTTEILSEALLTEKMGMSRREIHDVYLKYGVTASRLVELMQLSKYQFVYTGKIDGLCEPCTVITRVQPLN